MGVEATLADLQSAAPPRIARRKCRFRGARSAWRSGGDRHSIVAAVGGSRASFGVVHDKDKCSYSSASAPADFSPRLCVGGFSRNA